MAEEADAVASYHDVFEMLASIRRETDGHFLNRVANDPSILPHVRGYHTKIDADAIVKNRFNVVLAGQHGCIMFQQVAVGVCEAHTMVLPEGRGAWAVAFVTAALHWLFTRTAATEVFTRVPKGNKGALGLVRAIHGKFECVRKDGWVVDLDPVPVRMYSRNIFDWMRDAPGLVDRGNWFHHKLEAEYARLGKVEQLHDDDETHDRAVGAAVEMMLSGQPDKGVLIYNRWALMAGYKPVSITARSPLTVNIRDALVIVRENDFWVATCLSERE